jgi:hypothetical protein
MSGARAKFGILDPQTGSIKYKGVVSQISYGLTYEYQAATILGRFSPASVQHTAVDVVTITATSWRNFDHGPHVEMALPRIQDLLLYEPITLVVTDRASEKTGVADPRVAVIYGVIPVSYATGFVAKNLSEMSNTYVGLLVNDESTINAEDPTAVAFPA